MGVVLRYVGRIGPTGDREAVFGVPARDLTAGDVEERGLVAEELVAGGLYERVEIAPTGGRLSALGTALRNDRTVRGGK
jgi:hypothetical protein